MDARDPTRTRHRCGWSGLRSSWTRLRPSRCGWQSWLVPRSCSTRRRAPWIPRGSRPLWRRSARWAEVETHRNWVWAAYADVAQRLTRVEDRLDEMTDSRRMILGQLAALERQERTE